MRLIVQFNGYLPYRERWERTPWWVFVIPLLGFVLCIFLGVYNTEPIELGGHTRLEKYDFSQTRAGRSNYFYFWQNTGRSSGSIDLPECTGKNCGYVYLAVLLILVVIVCVLGSAFIPHFWVLSTLLILTFMIVIASRELLFRERRQIWR